MCLRRVRGLSTSGFVSAAPMGARQCSCTAAPSHLPILPRCPGQGLCFSLGTQPLMQPTQNSWDSDNTAQQRSGCCPQSAPERGSSTGTAATAPQPAAHSPCAMALPSPDPGSAWPCQPLLSPPHPPGIGNAGGSPDRDTGVGHSTAGHGQELIRAQSFTPIPGKPHSLQSQGWCQGKPCTLSPGCLRTHTGLQGWTAQPWGSISALWLLGSQA